MALDPLLQKICDVALSQVGFREVPVGSNRGPEIDKLRPAWKRAELAKLDAEAVGPVPADPYCSWGVTWCFREALGTHPFGHQIGGCHALVRAAMERDMWFELEGNDRKSDLLVGAYPGCAFVQLHKPFKEGAGTGHTGIIIGVDKSGWMATTVEWNSGQRVRKGARDLRDPAVRGLILPFGVKSATEDWPRIVVAGADLGKESTR